MPVKFKRTMVKIGGSFRITVPMEIANTLNIKHKDVLEIWLDDSKIVMVKVEKEE